MDNNQTNATENTAGAAQDNNQAQGQQNDGNNNPSSTAGDNGVKTFTQAEVDAMIEKRLARERKKYQQSNPAPAAAQATAEEGATAPAGTVEVDVTEDARQQAANIIAQANQRLIAAIAQSEATKLNINPNYIADAVRLADLSAVKVNDDGTVDTKSITDALEAVLTRMPILKAVAEAPAGGFKVGGQGNGNPQGNTWANNKNPGDVKRWNKNRY